MNYSRTSDAINSWKHILVNGTEESIDEMLKGVEGRFLGKGWGRDLSWESSMNRSSRRHAEWHCFVGGAEGGPRWMLGLDRVAAGRVSGGDYSLLGSPHGLRTSDAAEIIEEMKRDVVQPSASQAGLEVKYPAFSDASLVPPGVLSTLRAFCGSAGGEWPLSATQEPLWRRFVVKACRDETAFDLYELGQWFREFGWPPAASDALIERFINDSSLVAEYEDELRV